MTRPYYRPIHHEVEVFIGAPVAQHQLRELAGAGDTPGAFRKISAHLRDLVASLGKTVDQGGRLGDGVDVRLHLVDR